MFFLVLKPKFSRCYGFSLYPLYTPDALAYKCLYNYHLDADCSPSPTLEAVGKADLENMVASSFSINELSHEQCKKGISSEVPPGCFAEGKPHISNTTLQTIAMKIKDS